MALKMASHAATLSRLGRRSFVTRVAIAPGAALAPRTTPEIHPSPPMTAYWTSRIDPKTSKELNCTFVWRNARRMPPSAAMPAPTANA